MAEYYDTKYANEALIKQLGYTGGFGAGNAEKWLDSSGKRAEYNTLLQKYNVQPGVQTFQQLQSQMAPQGQTSSTYYDPKYQNEQILRQMGYTGYFGAGGAMQWLANSGKSQDYYNRLKAAGIDANNPTNSPIQQSILQNQQGQVNNPSLPNGTTLTPELQQVQQNELMNPNSGQLQGNGQQVNQQDPVQTPQINASQQQNAAQASTDPATNLNTQSGQYQATQVSGQTPQAQAQQGQVNALATVQGQLAKLYSDLDDGQIPPWAQGALMKANEEMAARGMGASSIGAAATVAAVQSSALNIAAQDAATYFQMDLTNLSNRQQTELFNTQLKQQSLLSDQAADNAAKQFNASSVAQLQQFQAQLLSQIQSQNADRVNSMQQFNVSEANKVAAQNSANKIAVDTFNNQQRAAVEQYNSQLANQREQFNAQMRFAIDQSNVTWRRQVNTANNASINAANQSNVQNMFNLSAQAQNNIWQAWRDEAYWMWQSNESQLGRNYGLALAANDRSFLQGQQNDAMNYQLYALAGQFAMNLWNS